MARQYVLFELPAAAVAAGNVKLCQVYGDDPGTEEFALNYSVNGVSPATHAVDAPNLSQTEANEWAAWVVANGGACQQFAVLSGPYNWPGLAAAMWDLHQVL